MTGKKINEKAELVISFDDYHPLNIRLAEMLKTRDLPGIFFIETLKKEAKEQIARIHEMGFKIGCHTLSHVQDLKALNVEECRAEMQIAKRQIEDITGEPCETLAYPRGRFNDQVIEIAKNSGFKEARTTHVLKTEPTQDSFRTPTTIHIYSGRKEYGGRNWIQMAEFYLDHVLRKGGIFHLWGHAEEIDRNGEWVRLDHFLKELNALFSKPI